MSVSIGDFTLVQRLDMFSSAAIMTALDNYWYQQVAGLPDAEFSQGQLEVLHAFGDMQNLNGDQQGATLAIVGGSKILVPPEGPFRTGFDLFHDPQDIFLQTGLCEYGQKVADQLADAVIGQIMQQEAQAILRCLGISSHPNTPKRISPAKGRFEEYLRGNKWYTPGVARRN